LAALCTDYPTESPQDAKRPVSPERGWSSGRSAWNGVRAGEFLDTSGVAACCGRGPFALRGEVVHSSKSLGLVRPANGRIIAPGESKVHSVVAHRADGGLRSDSVAGVAAAELQRGGRAGVLVGRLPASPLGVVAADVQQ